MAYGAQEMVHELRGLMEERGLLVPILDALANMNLPAELLEDIQNTVLRSLRSIEFEDLAVAVRFLFHSITKNNADKAMLGFSLRHYGSSLLNQACLNR